MIQQRVIFKLERLLVHLVLYLHGDRSCGHVRSISSNRHHQTCRCLAWPEASTRASQLILPCCRAHAQSRSSPQTICGGRAWKLQTTGAHICDTASIHMYVPLMQRCVYSRVVGKRCNRARSSCIIITEQPYFEYRAARYRRETSTCNRFCIDAAVVLDLFMSQS